MPATLRCCYTCGKIPEHVRLCERCQLAAYCSLECQKIHWKTNGHKKACAAVRQDHVEEQKHAALFAVDAPALPDTDERVAAAETYYARVHRETSGFFGALCDTGLEKEDATALKALHAGQKERWEALATAPSVNAHTVGISMLLDQCTAIAMSRTFGTDDAFWADDPNGNAYEDDAFEDHPMFALLSHFMSVRIRARAPSVRSQEKESLEQQTAPLSFDHGPRRRLSLTGQGAPAATAAHIANAVTVARAYGYIAPNNARARYQLGIDALFASLFSTPATRLLNRAFALCFATSLSEHDLAVQLAALESPNPDNMRQQMKDWRTRFPLQWTFLVNIMGEIYDALAFMALFMLYGLLDTETFYSSSETPWNTAMRKDIVATLMERKTLLKTEASAAQLDANANVLLRFFGTSLETVRIHGTANTLQDRDEFKAAFFTNGLNKWLLGTLTGFDPDVASSMEYDPSMAYSLEAANALRRYPSAMEQLRRLIGRRTRGSTTGHWLHLVLLALSSQSWFLFEAMAVAATYRAFHYGNMDRAAVEFFPGIPFGRTPPVELTMTHYGRAYLNYRITREVTGFIYGLIWGGVLNLAPLDTAHYPADQNAGVLTRLVHAPPNAMMGFYCAAAVAYFAADPAQAMTVLGALVAAERVFCVGPHYLSSGADYWDATAPARKKVRMVLTVLGALAGGVMMGVSTAGTFTSAAWKSMTNVVQAVTPAPSGGGLMENIVTWFNAAIEQAQKNAATETGAGWTYHTATKHFISNQMPTVVVKALGPTAIGVFSAGLVTMFGVYLTTQAWRLMKRLTGLGPQRQQQQQNVTTPRRSVQRLPAQPLAPAIKRSRFWYTMMMALSALYLWMLYNLDYI